MQSPHPHISQSHLTMPSRYTVPDVENEWKMAFLNERAELISFLPIRAATCCTMRPCGFCYVMACACATAINDPLHLKDKTDAISPSELYLSRTFPFNCEKIHPLCFSYCFSRSKVSSLFHYEPYLRLAPHFPLLHISLPVGITRRYTCQFHALNRSLISGSKCQQLSVRTDATEKFNSTLAASRAKLKLHLTSDHQHHRRRST